MIYYRPGIPRGPGNPFAPSAPGTPLSPLLPGKPGRPGRPGSPTIPGSPKEKRLVIKIHRSSSSLNVSENKVLKKISGSNTDELSMECRKILD
jgi:hypothetical protein